MPFDAMTPEADDEDFESDTAGGPPAPHTHWERTGPPAELLGRTRFRVPRHLAPRVPKYEQARRFGEPMRVAGAELFEFGDADNVSADLVRGNGNSGDVSLLFMDCTSPLFATDVGFNFDMTEVAHTVPATTATLL